MSVMLYEEILTRVLCKKWVYSKNKYKTVLSKELLLLVYAKKNVFRQVHIKDEHD
jgi:hypothetical protein